MVAKFFPPKQKLLSEYICSVLVILRMWGSWAPIPIMLTHLPACSNSSPISAPPHCSFPPSSPRRQQKHSHSNLSWLPSALRINPEHLPAGASLSHTLSPPLPQTEPQLDPELLYPCCLPWTNIFFRTFPDNPVRWVVLYPFHRGQC